METSTKAQAGLPDSRAPGASSPTVRRPRALYGVLTCAILVTVGLLWAKHFRAAQAAPGGGMPGRAGFSNGPVSVVAGTVIKKDVPIYLEGLGTVQAFNTVTVRARVDGQVERIAFTEGQDVREGDLLAQIDPAPFKTQLEQNQARKAQDEAQLVVGKLTLQRDASLLADKILAQQDYDTQTATVDQLLAAVKADQAAIENAQVQLNYTTIVSPLDGRTGIRQVDKGNIIHASDANGLVVITQLRPISVVFTLPEQKLGQIQEQLNAGRELIVEAVNRDNVTPLAEGKLAVVDNQIDSTTATIRLKATFPNEHLTLWPGQFVNVRLLVTTRKDGIVVPAPVVQRGPDGAYAFVIKSDGSVEVRPVKARIERGEALIEDDSLQPGEQVVVDGQYKLQKGSHVRIASASKAPGSGSPAASSGE